LRAQEKIESVGWWVDTVKSDWVLFRLRLRGDHRAGALGVAGGGFGDLLGGGGELGGGEGNERGVGEDFEADVFDVDGVGVSAVELDGEQAFEGAAFFVEVGELGADLAVDLVDEVITAGDDGVILPMRDVHFDGGVLGDEPALAIGIEDHGLTVEAEDAATFLLVGHGGVLDGGVDVALITGDGPGAYFGQWAGAVLDAGIVVADDADGGAEFEVFDGAGAPDEEGVVLGTFGAGAGADDGAVLDLPELGIAVPAGEVLAVEQGFKLVLGGEGGGEESEAGGEEQGFHHGWASINVMERPIFQETMGRGGPRRVGAGGSG
jgi:hypothetical protein